MSISEWLQELHEVLPMSRALILHGNVKDVLYYQPPETTFHNPASTLHLGQYYPIRRFLNRFMLDKGYSLIGHYDLLDGLEFHSQDQLDLFSGFIQTMERSSAATHGGSVYQVPGAQDARGSTGPQDSADSDTTRVSQTFSANSKDFYETFVRVRNLFDLRECPPAAFVIYFGEKLVGAPNQHDLAERSNIILINKIIENSRIVKNNPLLLIIVTDEIRKLPSEIYFGSPRCRQIHISKPSIEERKLFIHFFFGNFLKSSEIGSKDPIIENLAAYSEGLSHYDLHNLTLLSHSSKIPIEDAKSLVKRYKFGQKQSPWDKLSKEKVMGTPWKRIRRDHTGNPLKDHAGRYESETVPLDIASCLKERVIGQDHAVGAIETMVIRAIEGIQSSKASDSLTKQPKGIFLFAGPTGVGKTELTKAFTEWLFGDENEMLRFDMSEYNQEHSDQKLIGAPPGYVGHEQGGQLTNAVRKKPFSVILFDEIDKMHKKVWDIFLQILEDGRLTDGTGETVYFSETVIIMTSNLGGASHPHGRTMKEIEQHYVGAVRTFFRETLGRPEILNRIGMDNIIPFHSIDREFQEKIIWQKLNSVHLSYLEKTAVNVDFDSSVITFLIEDPEGFSRNGARGVEHLITTHIINPLARYLFFHPEAKEKGTTLKMTIHSGQKVETYISEG